MWIFTTQGFYSVVRHTDQRDKLIVRSRALEDLEALRSQIPTLEPFEDADADYRYRAVVGQDEWIAAIAQLAATIDYPNFKSEVAARQGHERASIYSRIWSALLPIQRRGKGDRD